MGGRAFHTRGYTAPRLPPKLYTTLSLDLQAKLRTVYPYVVCPPSVLEKPDHGDIDFLVVLDPDRPAVHPGEVADLLGAKDHISSGPHASSYALVHPIEAGGLSSRWTSKFVRLRRWGGKRSWRRTRTSG